MTEQADNDPGGDLTRILEALFDEPSAAGRAVAMERFLEACRRYDADPAERERIRRLVAELGMGEEPGDDGHVHHWVILAVQQHLPWVALGRPIPHTITLIRCTVCGLPDSLMLPGKWTRAQMRSAVGD
jgi:hypothetical protein